MKIKNSLITCAVIAFAVLYGHSKSDVKPLTASFPEDLTLREPATC